ncbi:MAG TPA: AAA family ATPase [Thermoplasmata archaeon]|nr:AAA family ATPase [Thermoplasmata archaeon]
MAKTISLKVSEALRADVGFGRARLNERARRELNVHLGDIIEIKGKKITGAIVWRARAEDNEKDIIRIDSLIRNNAGVSLGERVLVSKCEVREAVRIVLAPITDRDEKIRFTPGVGAIIRRAIIDRPVHKSDTIIIQGIAFTMGNTLPFGVVRTEPGGIVKITERTEIQLKETPIKQAELRTTKVSYEDIGGLNEEVKKVREMIELPLKHPEIFDRMGITPPKGVLLYGAPGTGKTLIAKAVANESGASFYSIQGPEIMSKYYGESEKQIRKKFEEAEAHAPSIIFIDELDSIAPKREDVYGEVERRVVAQMLTLMDGLNTREKVIVIAATNRIDAIDPALRRHGRFDREIEIGVPTRQGRREILEVHTRGMPLADDVDLDHISEKTHGYVGADLAALCREAAMKALSRYIPQLELEETIPISVLEKMEVTAGDFEAAMKEIEPSTMREILVEMPKVKWSDVGGLEHIKKELREAVEWPLKYPKSNNFSKYVLVIWILIFGIV